MSDTRVSQLLGNLPLKSQPIILIMEATNMEVTTHAPGTFCWVELAAVDAQVAKPFYTQLFDWAVEENDMGNGQVYTMYRHNGKYVAAQYQMSKEEQKQVGKSHWLNYISTNDVEKSAKVAAESGGTVISGPLDVEENGRLAVVQDPTGAIFALWEAKSHSGIEKAYEPGSLGWSELVTKDANVAGAFYTNLLGWGTRVQKMDTVDYTVFLRGEEQAGGMMEMTEEWGGVPSHWMSYFAVADCDVTAAKAVELGGNVCVPPTDIPGVGRFAVLDDPQGSTFSVISFEMPSVE